MSVPGTTTDADHRHLGWVNEALTAPLQELGGLAQALYPGE